VNHFDNADVYGNTVAPNGMLARALGEPVEGRRHRDEGRPLSRTAEHAYEALHIRHQCEQSLKNLKRDVVDIYYFHPRRLRGQTIVISTRRPRMAYRLKDEGKNPDYRPVGIQ